MSENSSCDPDKEISGRCGENAGVEKCSPETAGSVVQKSESPVEKSERKKRFSCIRKFFMKYCCCMCFKGVSCLKIYSKSWNIFVKNICNITNINICKGF